jgi:MFS family permease
VYVKPPLPAPLPAIYTPLGKGLARKLACSRHKLLRCLLVDDLRSAARPRRIPLFSVLFANAVSQVGDVMAKVAIPWFVLETTGSAAKMGITGAAIGAAMVFAGFFGGPVVDRVGFKRASVLADLMSGLSLALIPLLYLIASLAFWQLLVLVFLGTLLDTPGRPARRALLPELARLARMPLERANSAFEVIPRLSFLVGPPLAGVLIAAIGASNVLWVDAATFAVSAALIAWFVPSGLLGQERGTQEMGASGARRYLAELTEGIRFVRADLLIVSMILVVTVANLLDDPLISVILPVFAKAEYGSAVSVGLILGGFGAGAVTGTLLFGAVGHRLPRRLTFIVSFVVAGPMPYVVVALSPPLAVTVGLFALEGMMAGPLNPLISTVLLENIPQQMRGRILGVVGALAMAGIPFGALLGGFLVEGVGLRPTVIGMGSCYLALTLSMFLNPSLREMEAKQSSRDPQAHTTSR